jgi:hypothetical protein
MNKFEKTYQYVIYTIAILILFGAFVLPIMIGMSKEVWLWALT